MSADISNAVQAQYEAVVDLVVYSRGWEELRRAMVTLELVGPLWTGCSFGYKVDNLKSRIRQQATDLLRSEEEYLSGCRKNCSTRGSTERSIRELRDIRQCMA